jgi:ubiquinone/menaquinone biosynthesis C-methylase UbiE
VTEVIAVEPEPHLRQHAERAAREAPVPVTVVEAVAELLPFATAEFDAAVASLMLCSVADVLASLAEVHRVLRPDGELRFFAHVASQHRALRALQRAADATLWPGCPAAARSSVRPTPRSGPGCPAAVTSAATPSG